MSQDYYEILGVSRGAGDADIQKAYRRLARKHHPDLADDKEKAKAEFQKIQQAYDVLSDPQKRRLYDQLGPDFQSYAGAGHNPFGRGAGRQPDIDLGDLFGGQGTGGASLDELLRQFGAFGARGSKRAAGKPSDAPPREVREEITIPFGTSILGGQHQLHWERDGASENIAIKIPAGIEPGQTLRLRGQGASGPRGRRGDLLVKVNVAPHPHFERCGFNLRVVVPISLKEAIQGAKIDLPTPHGTISITVPPYSSSGRVLRLRGVGIRPEGKSAGDLLAELQIELPENPDLQVREALDQVAQSVSGPPRRPIRW